MVSGQYFSLFDCFYLKVSYSAFFPSLWPDSVRTILAPASLSCVVVLFLLILIQVKTTAHNTEILIGLKIVSYLYAWNKVDFGNEWSCTFLLLFCFLSPDYTGEC